MPVSANYSLSPLLTSPLSVFQLTLWSRAVCRNTEYTLWGHQSGIWVLCTEPHRTTSLSGTLSPHPWQLNVPFLVKDGCFLATNSALPPQSFRVNEVGRGVFRLCQRRHTNPPPFTYAITHSEHIHVCTHVRSIHIRCVHHVCVCSVYTWSQRMAVSWGGEGLGIGLFLCPARLLLSGLWGL